MYSYYIVYADLEYHTKANIMHTIRSLEPEIDLNPVYRKLL